MQILAENVNYKAYVESTMNKLADSHARTAALNITQSYIVQAPAGSGKTELLTQRYLALVANACQYPEEIIAITFTRKAVHEMQQRILNALSAAKENTAIESAHQQITRKLALKVLAKDKQQDWNLLQNPARLQIFTIDSLCQRILTQLPVLAEIGPINNIADNADEIYEIAALQTLQMLEDQNPWQTALTTLVSALDNKLERLKKLIVNMLAKRQQWLPYLSHRDQRKFLEDNLKNVIEAQLGMVYANIPQDLHSQIVMSCQFIGNNFDEDKPLRQLASITELPSATVENLATWQLILRTWVTDKITWRKSLDIRIGFPNDNEGKAYKKIHKEIIAQLATIPNLLNAISDISQAPRPTYADDQWQLLNALLTILPVAVAQLQLVFQSQNCVDHSEVNLRASMALGQLDNPSNLNLNLDHKIQHILIDEFQDTAIAQFHLLEKLTSGWQIDDGRTLFIVGDPQQSIYRFRQAEVSLFLQAQQFGIGDIPLQNLTLSSNFRSDKIIVDNNNALYNSIMPSKNNLVLSAIAFCPSTAMQYSQTGDFNLNLYANESEQAVALIKQIKSLQLHHPEETIAILVATRSQLTHIIPQLNKQQLAFRATEIDALASIPLILDLFALTSALLNFNDDLAWYTILRAPWLGLNLSQILTISQNPAATVLAKLKASVNIAAKKTHGRITQFIQVIDNALQQRHRFNLSQWLEATWLALAGPACIKQVIEIDYAASYFELLEQHTTGGDILDLQQFKTKLNQTYINRNSPAANPIEIMTIHKAKGLEFDNVFLPSLDKKTKSNSPELFAWLQQTTQAKQEQLLLAPIKIAKKEAIYDYLTYEENKKQQYELVRKFYVATTRAKKRCFLSSCVKQNKKNEYIIPKNSLLSLLEYHFSDTFTEFIPKEQAEQDESFDHGALARLAADFNHPFRLEMQDENPKANPLEINFSTNPQAIIGTVAHKIIEILSQSNKLALKGILAFAKQHLLYLGLAPHLLKNALSTIETAYQNLVADPQAQWLLKPRPSAKSELSLSLHSKNKVKNLIIDRTFIEDNTRWIIDYKYTQPNNTSLENFLAEQRKTYQSQLNQYAQAFAQLESLPIKLALYFPLLPHLFHWHYEPTTILEID
ncbi:MAG: UvrD-helicase domain-containing protein [Pseudomonadota bacterium]